MGAEFEELHPRDGEGQFTHSSMGAWMEQVDQRINQRMGRN